MNRRNLLPILIIFVFLLTSGCASTGNGRGFPFFGKKTEAPPPPTTVNPQVMLAPVMSGHEIQVQPPAAGPNPPPSGEIIGQPPYSPPISQSTPPSSSAYPLSTTYPSSTPSSSSSNSNYGSSGSVSTPSPSGTYPSSGSNYSNPPSNYSNPSSPSSGYPSSGSGSSTSNGYYGTSTSIQAPVNQHYNRHYVAKVQTYSPSSVSYSSGIYENNQNYPTNPSLPDYSQNEIPVTRVTTKTADQYTFFKGGSLSVYASSTPEFLVQSGIYTRQGHAQTTILPQNVSYESHAGESPSMPDVMAKNMNSENTPYNPDSKWDDSERYESPSMWEAMAAQNINTILGNGNSFQIAENPQIYAQPLTARDYQIVVRGQSPKKENASVLTAHANAIISGRIY